MASAKEMVKQEIAKLTRKVEAYKELYGEESEKKEAHSEPDADNAGGKSDKDEDNKSEAVDEKSDMDKMVEIIEALKTRIEGLENKGKEPAVKEAVEDKEVPEKKAELTPTQTQAQISNPAVTDSAQKLAQEKKEDIVNPSAPNQDFEAKKKEEVDAKPEEKPEEKKEEVADGEVKKEEEPKKETEATSDDKKEEDEEDDKKPKPPVMESLKLRNIKIEPSFKVNNKLKEAMKRNKIMR